MKARPIIASVISAIALSFSSDLEAASFIPLGFLRSADNDGDAYGVSDDAAFVGGRSSGANFVQQAVRWTARGSVFGLGFLPGASSSSAFAMSADGQVLVGVSGGRAFRWSAASSMSDLGMLPGKTYHVAWGVSGDGSIVVGSRDIGGNEEHVEPFRWTANEGMIGLGFLAGASRGEALAISKDGQTIVGYSGNDRGQAFRRGTDGVMQALGFLSGYVESIARGVSSDGSVTVGMCRSGSGVSQAFIWTAARGMQGLGALSGFSDSDAHDVSGDGSIVVGTCQYRKAFIWDATDGIRDLQNVLTNKFGLNLSGWSLSDVEAISPDGTVIVGTGTNPQGSSQAWMVKLATSQPTLSVRLFGSSVVVSWPTVFSNFALQSRGSFAPSDFWSAVTNTLTVTTGQFVVTNSPSGGARFYRLKSQ